MLVGMCAIVKNTPHVSDCKQATAVCVCVCVCVSQMSGRHTAARSAADEKQVECLQGVVCTYWCGVCVSVSYVGGSKEK